MGLKIRPSNPPRISPECFNPLAYLKKKPIGPILKRSMVNNGVVFAVVFPKAGRKQFFLSGLHLNRIQ
jgi:hypothetical protein